MVQQVKPENTTSFYPDSDGQPMADNTLQFEWIVTIKENLELLLATDEQIFIAGDLLWYPVEGDSKLCRAPDVLVACGRPKGYRGSYKQWEEANIAPQVVFEILSPSNTLRDLAEKFAFYDRFGVEEYYLYDPNRVDFNGWIRQDERFVIIEPLSGWVSPRLGIRFELTAETLKIFTPSGDLFLTYVELGQRMQAAEARAIAAEQAQQAAVPQLLSMGLSVEQVAAALGLAVEDVRAIAPSGS
ncbi:MAG: Uma2 family endonuclease [Cyanobacteria bacterium P01_A01_bin.123]